MVPEEVGLERLVLSEYSLLDAIIVHVCFQTIHLLFLLAVCFLRYDILTVQLIELLLQLGLFVILVVRTL